MNTNHVFDKSALISALTDLSVRLGELNIDGEIVIVGGAYMAIAHDARRLTRDVDALVLSSDVIIRAAEDVAGVRQLPVDWLNDTVSAFFEAHPGATTPAYSAILVLPHLTISCPPMEYVLAMKALSARGAPRQDFQDTVVLLRKLGQTELPAVKKIVEDCVGKISPMSLAFLEAALLQALTPIVPAEVYVLPPLGSSRDAMGI